MKHSMRDRWWIGIPLIAVGLVILLKQMGYDIDIGYVFRTYWPVFLIWWGFKGLTEIRRNGGYAAIGPVIVLAIGGYFLARNLDWIDYSMGEFIRYLIPVMLIGGGLFVLIGPRRRDRKHKDQMQSPPPEASETYKPLTPEELEMPSTFDEQFEKTFGKPNGGETSGVQGNASTPHGSHHSGEQQSWKQFSHDSKGYEDGQHGKHGQHGYGYEDYGDGRNINKSTFIGDLHLGQDVFQLKPMNISTFIGDTVIDLTKAQIPYGETKINISSFIGDVKVFVPADMDLGITVTTNSFIGDMSLLNQKRGGFLSSAQTETPHYREAGKKVRIVVSVFIGDVKVNKVG
ncbi:MULTISPECIES: cell wall-active antibiotics response protein LiaF [Paenibacillus]|uniref:cell wall-active antibiotics response protein LiaF n=1 Tax=Paenibacillus TaxID=44249 RepID=UPI001F25E838|nr:cell wall-active antibiotics response protein LiaF [Paenibacillus sp. JJ-223]CAH1206686.1 hypothetical protein PAECIP111890_02809 [Paenibacillus sp. JJ-223]